MEVLLHDLKPVLSEADSQAAELQQAQRLQRQTAMSDVRRALVLDAARSVFAAKGLEGASIREIARKAGYTAGAIYSYFESKDAICAALLGESLERLNVEVASAREQRSSPRLTLALKAQAWFGFYASNPHDLELCLYLIRGRIPGGSAHPLHSQLHDALRPCEAALQAMGLSPEAALRENTALFAHGLGLLLLHHNGQIRIFDQSFEALFQCYLEQLALRLDPSGAASLPPSEQGDLFGV